MKKNLVVLILLLVCLTSSCTDSDIDSDSPDMTSEDITTTDDIPSSFDFTDMSGNPVFTSIFTADPSAHVWQNEPDKIYVYPSHDIFPSRGCDFMDKYHVFSSTNMVDWIDEGEILSSADIEWRRAEGGFMWAPDCAYKDGVYYFYFPHPTGDGDAWNNTWKIGVAISDKPSSGFIDNGMVTLSETGEPIGGDAFIDPCVFEDTDGSYYMAVGGGGHCFIGKMGDDMMTVDGGFTDVSEQLPNYHEGPWLFKRGDFYYLMYPGKVNSSDNGDSMLYAMSKNPLGPWDYKGVLLDPVSTGDTSHGSIIEFKNRWYLFYHNAEISGGNGTLRSVCVDELFWNDDGTIKKVEQTETGVNSIGERTPKNTQGLETKYYDIVGDNYTEYTQKTVYWADGENFTAETANIENGNVHNLHIEGAYIEISDVDGGNGGKALLTVTYASADNASAKVDASGDLTGNGYFLKLMSTGGWDNYDGQAKCLIDLNAGNDNIIRVTGGMGGFNVESVTVLLIP